MTGEYLRMDGAFATSQFFWPPIHGCTAAGPRVSDSIMGG